MKKKILALFTLFISCNAFGMGSSVYLSDDAIESVYLSPDENKVVLGFINNSAQLYAAVGPKLQNFDDLTWNDDSSDYYVEFGEKNGESKFARLFNADTGTALKGEVVGVEDIEFVGEGAGAGESSNAIQDGGYLLKIS